MSTIYCEGNGECLEQKFEENTYQKKRGITCFYNCTPLKCSNHIVCNAIRPRYVYDGTKGVCLPCYEKFGKLKFKYSGEECPVCMYEKVCVKLPHCDHYICVDCFKRFHIGPYRENEPKFPYSEIIKKDYYEQPGHIKWHTDLPLVKIWLQRHDEWEKYYQNKYDGEENLRKCPICRK